MNKKSFSRLIGVFLAGALCLPQAFLPQHNRRPIFSSFDTLAPQVKVSAAHFPRYFSGIFTDIFADAPKSGEEHPVMALRTNLEKAESETEIAQLLNIFLKQLFGRQVGITFYAIKRIPRQEDDEYGYDFFFRTIHREGMEGLRYYSEWVKMPRNDEKNSCLRLTSTFKKTTFLHITDRSVNPDTHKPFVLSDIFLYMNNDEIKELTNRLGSKDDYRELISYINTHNKEPKILADFFKTYQDTENASNMIRQISDVFPELVERINESLNFSVINPENNQPIAHILINNWAEKKDKTHEFQRELFRSGRQEQQKILNLLFLASGDIARHLSRVHLMQHIQHNNIQLSAMRDSLLKARELFERANSYVHDSKSLWIVLANIPRQLLRKCNRSLADLSSEKPPSYNESPSLRAKLEDLSAPEKEWSTKIKAIESLISNTLGSVSKSRQETENFEKNITIVITDSSFFDDPDNKKPNIMQAVIQQQEHLLRDTAQHIQSLFEISHDFIKAYAMHIGQFEPLLNTFKKMDEPAMIDVSIAQKSCADSWNKLTDYFTQIREILHKSPQKSTHSLPITETNLSRIIDNVVQEFTSLCLLPSHTINVYREADLHALTNPEIAARILENLIDNAQKYSPPASGEENKTIWISAWSDEITGKIIITVKDEGEGLSPENLEKLREFAPSQRFHGPEFKGSGVGLSFLVPDFRRVGGEIEVKLDINNKGLVFSLIFPRATTPDGNSSATTPPETFTSISEQVIAQSI